MKLWTNATSSGSFAPSLVDKSFWGSLFAVGLWRGCTKTEARNRRHWDFAALRAMMPEGTRPYLGPPSGPSSIVCMILNALRRSKAGLASLSVSRGYRPFVGFAMPNFTSALSPVAFRPAVDQLSSLSLHLTGHRDRLPCHIHGELHQVLYEDLDGAIGFLHLSVPCLTKLELSGDFMHAIQGGEGPLDALFVMMARDLVMPCLEYVSLASFLVCSADLLRFFVHHEDTLKAYRLHDIWCHGFGEVEDGPEDQEATARVASYLSDAGVSARMDEDSGVWLGGFA